MSSGSIVKRALMRVGAALAIAGMCASPVLSAFAQDAPAAPTAMTAGTPETFWSPGPDASGDDTYLGAIDQVTYASSAAISFTVAGWAGDTTAVGWAGFDNIQVFNGQMEAGGSVIGQGTVGGSRPDVAATVGNPSLATSGFSVNVVAGALQPGVSTTLYLYGHTASKGWWGHAFTVQVPAAAPPGTPAPGMNPNGPAPTVGITSPDANQNLLTNSTYQFSGTANDPGNGVHAIDVVDVWIDGQKGTQGSIHVGQATVPGDGTWYIDFSPGSYPAMPSTIFVYAHSSATGKESMAYQNFNTLAPR